MYNREKDNPQKYISQLVNVFSQVPGWYEENDREIKFRDAEYNDLNHALELTTFGGVQGYKLALGLKENRIKRREAKDANELMKPLYDLIKKHQHLLSEMKKCAGEINNVLGVHKARVYSPRVEDSPLAEVIAKAQKNKAVV